MKSLLVTVSFLVSLATHPALAEKPATRDEVIARYGQPKGVVKKYGSEFLIYDGGPVEIRDNRVVEIPADFEARADKRAAQRKFEEEQKAKGLVKAGDVWVTPAEAARRAEQAGAAASQNAVRDVLVIANGGKKVDLKTLLVPGKVTIVDFYADWCGPCKAISPSLEKLAKDDPGVVLRKVDIVNWTSAVARQYGLNSIPNIRVYDAAGKPVGAPSHNLKQVQDNVKKAKGP